MKKKYLKLTIMISIILIEIIIPIKELALTSYEDTFIQADNFIQKNNMIENINNTIDIYPIITMIISLIFVLISDILWRKYGKYEKNNDVIEKVENYPPKGYNSAEVTYLYNGYLDNRDSSGVVSLLLYLANKGYIKIEEASDIKYKYHTKKQIRITKLKEYDGDNINEKLFLHSLFVKERTLFEIIKEHKKKSDSNIATTQTLENENNYVDVEDLYERFYSTINQIDKNLSRNKEKIFEKSSLSKQKWLIMMIITIYILIISKSTFIMLEGKIWQSLLLIIFELVFFCMGFYVTYVTIFTLNEKVTTFYKALFKILMIIFGILFMGGPIVLEGVLQFLQENYPIYFITYIVGMLCISIMMVFLKKIPRRRTSYGNEMLEKINGLKKFIETADEQKLKELMKENSNYFYDILPYAYALNISDVWINQFETISLKAPNWYHSRDNIDTYNQFKKFMNKTMPTIHWYMVSEPDNYD